MRAIALMLLLHSGILMAQKEVYRLEYYHLSGAVYSVSEKKYYPEETELDLEESIFREFDERGRMIKWAANSKGYGDESTTYTFNNEKLIQILNIEEGFQSKYVFLYQDSLHVATYYFEEELDKAAYDKKDTLIYFQDHYKIQSIDNQEEVFSNKDVYMDDQGRDTLHIVYSTKGEKDYKRRLIYIQNTDWCVDETIIDDKIVANSKYKCKDDGTHVFTFSNPKYELFMTREEKYNQEGFLVLRHTIDRGRGTTSYLEYTYIIDDHGNWLQRKAVNKAGELFEVVERSIVYFK